MIYRILMIILWLQISLEAVENIDAAMWKASNYVTSGEYVLAVQTYQNLLSAELPDWQRELIQYNIATAVLSKGLNQEALALLNNLPVDEKTPPLFKRSLETNLALTQLNQPEVDWLTAMKALQKATTSNCQIYEIMTKGQPCESNHNEWVKKLKQIRAYIKQQVAKKEGESLSLMEALFIFAIYFDEWKEKSPHEQLLTQERARLQPLEALLDEEQRKSFEKFWSLINEKKWQEAEQMASELSEQILSQLESQQNHLVDGINPIVKRVLNEFSLQSGSVQNLEKYLALAAKLAKQKKWQEGYAAALQSVKAANQSLDKGHRIEASLHLGIANGIIQQTKFNKSAIPQKVLMDIIADEKNDLRLTQFMLDKDKLEEVPDDLFKQLYKEQNETLAMVEDYYQSVLDFQKKDFAKKCQCSPWNQVLPLVEEGKQAAEDAAEELNKTSPQFAFVRENQKKAINRWEKALEMQQKQSEDSQSNSSNEQSQAMNQVFQYLQEMDQEDQRPAGQPSEQLGGFRPW